MAMTKTRADRVILCAVGGSDASCSTPRARSSSRTHQLQPKGGPPMRQNISPLARDARLVVALPLAIIVMISAGITSVLGIFAAIFGVVMLLTALTGYDPTYDLF